MVGNTEKIKGGPFMRTTQQIIFKIQDGEYGLDVSKVNGIETLHNVVAVPNVASHILGIINLRGQVLPIYSLRRKFGLEEVPVNEQTKIIVTTSSGITIAFKVDEVKEIIECSEDKLSQFPVIARTEETAYVDVVANHNGRLILLLNQDNILGKQEAEAITELVNELK